MEANALYMTYAVLHCTVGDVLIGTSALALALVAAQARRWPQWNYASIACLVVALALPYTAFSEWNNTARGAWTYSELMPTLRFGDYELGLSPLLQWLLLPPIALYLMRTPLRG